MNRFYKVYCRIFQFCFKMAIPLLPYYNPVILDKVEDIASVLKDKKFSKVMLVTDKSIRSFGITEKLEKHLAKNSIIVTVYDEVVANPTVDNVENARKLYLENNCEALIGFGGGSAIDCAKAVGARVAKPKQQIKDMVGILRILKRIPLLFAIPTTAGTGTETTVATVITEPKTKHKYMISDFPLIPKYAVLDPEVTRTLPAHITAATGMDVLVHAIESYIGNSTTKKTREQALKATELVYKNLLKAYENGDDMEARRNMLTASYLGGCAFTVSYVGYCHAVSHTLSGMYNTPHGLANAVLIPYVLEAYGAKIYKKLKDLAIAAGLCSLDSNEEIAAKMFIESIRFMNKQMNIPEKIAAVKKEDIEQLSKYANAEANPIYPVPVLLSRNELERFYYDVLDDSTNFVDELLSKTQNDSEEQKELVLQRL